MPIIEVDHLSKEFRLGQLTSLGQALRNGASRLLGRPMAGRAPFKALDDVSFSVEPGEVLGIIGHNGAGKSTLLKILAGISQPTRGRVAVRGRVAPLIEVGAGLVPDMTGRENVFLNASILGMKRAEIKRKFDAIVAFAELEEFIDTPVKRYSSGMQVRLGFSIATSVEAEILIVDEVLAVGDLAFQRKCFDRMEHLIKSGGRTVLLVSHNIRQVARICTRGLLLDHGRTVIDGDPVEVSEVFFSQSNHKIEAQALAAAGRQGQIVSSGEVELEEVRLFDGRGSEVATIEVGSPLRFRARLRLARACRGIEFVVGIHRTDFVYLTAAGSRDVLPDATFAAGVHEIEYVLPNCPFAPGTYSFRIVVVERNGRTMFQAESLRPFTVRSDRVVALNNSWRLLELPTELRIDRTSFVFNECRQDSPVKEGAA